MAGVAHLSELERCPALLCPKSPSIPSPSIMSSYCFGFRCLHAHAGIKVAAFRPSPRKLAHPRCARRRQTEGVFWRTELYRASDALHFRLWNISHLFVLLMPPCKRSKAPPSRPESPKLCECFLGEVCPVPSTFGVCNPAAAQTNIMSCTMSAQRAAEA